MSVADKYNDNNFVSIPGVELVMKDAGHWNVYLRDEKPALPPYECYGIEKVKNELKRKYSPNNVMLVPHQTSTYCLRPVEWDTFDAELTPIVELYSHWGSDEYFGNPLQCEEVDVHPPSFIDVALERGYKMGFIGSTDDHGGAPGDGTTFYNPIGAGLACVWADNLTRQSVFDALMNRACYATTGARIMLKFSCNGMPMGSIIKEENVKRKFRIEVEGPDKIKEIVLIKNNRELCVFSCRHTYELVEYMDDKVREYDCEYYYVRVVLEDGETAWASPIWFEEKVEGILN